MKDTNNQGKSLKTVDLRFDICRDIEQVLKIGRDFQNKDGYRGAHYDTVKLLCDAIEYQQEQLAKTKVGDVAKLREALVQCELFLGYVSRHGHPTLNPGDECTACRDADELRGMVVRALSAPPRNCDVGTAQEQAERWYWRYHVGHLCQSCPLGPRKWSEVDAGTLCFSEWQQMPYEEGGVR